MINQIYPEFIISYNYNHIIRKNILNLLPENHIINLHISLLPWNRGAHPNIWSFLDNTPKGVSIHLIDEGLDTGDILIQKELYIDEKTHTLQSSYDFLHAQIQDLFMENWNKIKNSEITPVAQTGKGTFHYKKDFDKISDLISEKGWNTNIEEFIKAYETRRKNENR